MSLLPILSPSYIGLFTAIKMLNASLAFGSTIYACGRWIRVSESEEVKKTKETQLRLEQMEKKIDQIWALQMYQPAPNNEANSKWLEDVVIVSDFYTSSEEKLS